MSKIYMAIDASSEGSGVMIMEDKEIIYKTTIKRSKGLSEYQHLSDLYRQYKTLIYKYQPDIIITEDIYIGMNGVTVKLLGTIRGIIHALAIENSKPLEIVHTMTMKACIKKLFPQYKKEEKVKIIKRGKDKGKEKMEVEKDKDFVFRILKKEYELDDTTDNNQTDALALILTYLER